MKQAIVTGATGFVGSAVVRELLEHDIEVLALSRRPRADIAESCIPIHRLATCLELDLEHMAELPARAGALGWRLGNQCVFFHFAWAGRSRLTDGGIDDQVRNVARAAGAVVAARALGCIRFVNAGTLEETFLERHLQADWLQPYHNPQQELYAVAKLAARDMCRLVAYLQKIEYVHTRFSAFVDESLAGGGFIAAVLRQIRDGAPWDKPTNAHLFDLIPLREGARAYRLIGEHGVNKADYVIGSGFPRRLEDYFAAFDAMKRGVAPAARAPAAEAGPGRPVRFEDFQCPRLHRDTGFSLGTTLMESLAPLLKS
ncbi:MAG: NAD-dependent epimerase/dehydratase family protein [Planctomycetota bacterium]